MKVTRDQIKARAQELRSQKFTIRATLEMNAGARPLPSTRKNTPAMATQENGDQDKAVVTNKKDKNLPVRNIA